MIGLPPLLLLGEKMQTVTNGPCQPSVLPWGTEGWGRQTVHQNGNGRKKTDVENKCGLALPCSHVYPPIFTLGENLLADNSSFSDCLADELLMGTFIPWRCCTEIFTVRVCLPIVELDRWQKSQPEEGTISLIMLGRRCSFHSLCQIPPTRARLPGKEDILHSESDGRRN